MPSFHHWNVSDVNLNSGCRPFVIAAALALSWPASSQTLDEALAIAYESSPALEAARARLRAADEQAAQTDARTRPTLSLEGDLGLREHETQGSTKPASWSIGIDQVLYHGAVATGIGRSVHVVGSARAGLAEVEQHVLLDVARSYTDVVLAHVILDRAISNEQRLASHLEATEDRFRVGLSTLTDVAQARARLAGARADRERAQGQVMSASARFRQVVGVSPASPGQPAVPDGLPASLEEATARAVAEHPAVVRAIEDERTAWLTADVMAAELEPSLSLRAEFRRARDGSFEHVWRDDVRVLTRFVVPIYQGGLASARTREARQHAAALKHEVHNIRRQVEAGVVSAWQSLKVARAEIGALEEEVAANATALEGVTNELRAGLRTVLAVLDAEQALFISEVSLARARSQEVTAAYELLAATGRLNVRSLGLPVAVYDERAYHAKARSALWGYGDNTIYADDWFE